MVNLNGIIAAMVTPMDNTEAVDVKGLRRLVNVLVDSGVHGLFCLGTTGEFYSLSEYEKELVVYTVVEEAAGRVPVFAGTGAVTTREVVALTKRVENSGIQAVSVITPYFIAPSQQELYMHYLKISEDSKLPVILYNIPMRTGVHLEAETVARLSKLPNIIGIKDSSGKFENIKAYLDMTERKSFSVVAGTDSLIYSTLEAGGTGAIAATANVIPKLVVSIYEHFRAGRFPEAKAAQEKLTPLRDAFRLGTAPGVLKEAVNAIGIEVGPSRSPISGLSGEALRELKTMIKNNY
jgi:4-hydroxy-tetrahydrodipicolinate synthase